MAFWGITLETTKRYTQEVNESFHVSMAALEPAFKKGSNDHVSVMVERESSEFLLCTLHQDKQLQQPLDLHFGEGEKITFFLTGEGVVHLTGYMITSDEFDEENSEVEDSDEDVIQRGPKRKAMDFLSTKAKKSKYEGESDDEDSISGDSDDDDDDSEDDSDDDDSDESEELVAKVPVKNAKGAPIAKSGGNKENKNLPAAGRQQQQVNAKQKKQNAGQQQQQQQQKQIQKEVNGNSPATNSGSPKKKRKRNKGKGGNATLSPGAISTPATPKGTPMTPGNEQTTKQTPKPNQANQQTPKQPKPNRENQQTPKTPKQNPNQQTPKQNPNQQTPKQQKQNQANQQTPKKTPKPNETPKQQPQTPKPKLQKLQGGVAIEDLKVGEGKEAKAGAQVNLYYVGRFQKNNKVFDSVKKGETPFKFRLGRGEVIKGWDIGVQGMKIGGTRRITIPAAQAYGSKGNEAIPPNSDLVFEVQLEQVN